jgi:tetratricopeptide (TPR) repeat protein
MDVDKLLNTEARTGIKNDDIDSFLAKIQDVQAQLDGLQNGTLDPNDVKIPGQKTEEEIREEAEEKARRDKERAERKAKEKAEEREKWWRGAEMRMESMEDRRKGKSNRVEIDGEMYPKPKAQAKDCLDYSVWEKWIPDDPESLREMQLKEKEMNEVKDKEFEKNNPEFCTNFIEDMKKREKSKLRKETTAARQKQKGNVAFAKRDYEAALRRYREALDEVPFLVPVLSNIAQCHIKLKQYDDAVEFCTRALYLNPKWVKAYSRRALARRRTQNYEEALKDYDKGLSYEPENESLIKERKGLVEEWEEVKGEAAVVAAMDTTPRTEVTEDVAEATAPENSGLISNHPVPASDSPAPAPAVPLKVPTEERPKPFVIVDKLMGHMLSEDASDKAVTARQHALAVLKEKLTKEEPTRIYFRTKNYFQLLVGAFSELSDEQWLSERMGKSYGLALLEVIAAACVNRKNQQLFVKSKGLEVVTRRMVGVISSKDGAIPVDAAIALAKFFEINTEHEFTRKQIFKPKHQEIIPSLVEILYSVKNAAALGSIISSLSLLCYHGQDEDTSKVLFAGCGLFKRNVVEATAEILDADFLASKQPAPLETREDATRLLANLMLHGPFRAYLASESVVKRLLGCIGSGNDTTITKANALAALMNGAVENATTPTAVVQSVRSELVKHGAVSLLLIMLGTSTYSTQLGEREEILVRAAGLLARCALDPDGVKKLREEAAFPLLAEITASSSGVILGHLVRTVAVCGKDGDAKLTKILREKNVVAVLAKTMADGASLGMKLKKDEKMCTLMGNTCKALIPVVKDAEGPAMDELRSLGIANSVIEVLKNCEVAAVRKNAAIVLARIARNSKLGPEVRALRGVEILMSLQKDLGV